MQITEVEPVVPFLIPVISVTIWELKSFAVFSGSPFSAYACLLYTSYYWFDVQMYGVFSGMVLHIRKSLCHAAGIACPFLEKNGLPQRVA